MEKFTSGSLTHYKIHHYGEGNSLHSEWGRHDHYHKFTNVNPVDDEPEIFAKELPRILPSYITTIINFGCANGRDFIPFQDKYRIIGFDLVPGDYIEWVCKTDNLTYYQCSMEDYMALPTPLGQANLSTALIYTNVSLFYLNSLQEQFISYLLNNGCKNMAFQEYDENGIHGTFQPGKHKDLFSTHNYRNDVVCYTHIDNKL